MGAIYSLAGETADVGVDAWSPVTDDYDPWDNSFTGEIVKITIRHKSLPDDLTGRIRPCSGTNRSDSSDAPSAGFEPATPGLGNLLCIRASQLPKSPMNIGFSRSLGLARSGAQFGARPCGGFAHVSILGPRRRQRRDV